MIEKWRDMIGSLMKLIEFNHYELNIRGFKGDGIRARVLGGIFIIIYYLFYFLFFKTINK